ncbi:predicted protein [Arabidopsis lyrata subsp. lyrata]|uniref:Predicted protein n=1 Tax=Arabidopsis lyrata subsp. lyrata TaxID=81972 RepID=D7MK78_ARALL|nr:predicted protein [Arabidopsis lyrata subsp. lyrata]
MVRASTSEALIIYGNGENRGTKRRSVVVLDLDILDCPVCCEALTIPIFQVLFLI